MDIIFHGFWLHFLFLRLCEVYRGDGEIGEGQDEDDVGQEDSTGRSIAIKTDRDGDDEQSDEGAAADGSDGGEGFVFVNHRDDSEQGTAQSDG